MNAWQRLDALLDSDNDLAVRLEVASECCWSCEVRLVDPQPMGTPDHSHVVFAVAGATAEDSLTDALDELAKWRGL